MKKLLWMTAAMALAVSAASAQQFWDQKPYENWSKEECKRMLEHSPWAERWDDAEVVFAPVNRQTELGTDATRQVNYVVQFRSALPMRRAVVRMAFLQATKGHRAKPEEQQRFRQQSAGFLSASFDEFVVLHVLYGSNIPEIDRSLAVYWQQQTSETVKDVFSLIGSNGKRVSAVHYEVLPGAGREFEVTFPRMVNEAPIVSEADKSLALEFRHPAISDPQSEGTPRSQRVLMEFKLKDMISQGHLVF